MGVVTMDGVEILEPAAVARAAGETTLEEETPMLRGDLEPMLVLK